MTIGESVLRTAIGELGTKELPANSNRVKYNEWYYGREVSGSAYPWCMAFVQWCYDTAGYPLPFRTASCSALLGWYISNAPQCVTERPVKGDIIIYNFGHTGLFESSGEGTVTAIEGNTAVGNESNGGEVMRRTRSKGQVLAYIHAYDGSLDETDGSDDRIHSVADAPAWAQPELQRLIDRGALKGKSGGDLDLSEDMLRVLIICQRMVDEARY